ncbi:MAG: DNA adenine methylase [Flavobacteriales bacterium]|nr:DNA adenine methylase [Flavobacteriales bacterium]
MPKTPISYYGGKLNMVKDILPLIPEHTIYTETFFGGGAIFFAKDKSKVEVINDTNNMVITFFEKAQNNFKELKKKIEGTSFSRATYKVANTIYDMPHLFNCLQQAWAFFVATNMGFACKIGSWGYDRYGTRSRSFNNKKLRFDTEIQERLKDVEIESNDATKVILRRDAIDAFHFVDPPYVGTNQGHYAGYTEEDFQRLLTTLSMVKGKFLLSSYPSELLERFTKNNGWNTKVFDKPLSASKLKDGAKRKRKTEVLTANYPI